MVIDRGGTIHIVYSGYVEPYLSQDPVHHAWKPPGGEWQTETISQKWDFYQGPVMAATPDGVLHVVGDTAREKGLRHYWKVRGGGWEGEELALPEGVGVDPGVSLGVTAAGGLVASFSVDRGAAIYIGHLEGQGQWRMERTPLRGWSPVFAPSGSPLRFVYQAGGRFLVARQEPSGEWSAQPMGESRSRVGARDVAFGQDGEIQVAFISGDKLWHVAKEGGEWATTPLWEVGCDATGVSIGVGPTGQAVIAYYDSYCAESATRPRNPNSGLRYARRQPDGSWQRGVVASGNFVGEDNSLIVDGSGKAHLAYVAMRGFWALESSLSYASLDPQ
ncbi:hypothetical protein IIA16_01565 [bacterium]|nr:hypothetical protein [bacterium]